MTFQIRCSKDGANLMTSLLRKETIPWASHLNDQQKIVLCNAVSRIAKGKTSSLQEALGLQDIYGKDAFKRKSGDFYSSEEISRDLEKLKGAWAGFFV